MTEASEQKTTDLVQLVRRSDPVDRIGRLSSINGTVLRASGLAVSIGQACILKDPVSDKTWRAEVIGYANQEAILSPLDPLVGLPINASVHVINQGPMIACGPGLVGRVLGANGHPIDHKGEIGSDTSYRPIYAPSPNPIERPPITSPISTGVRIIDTLLTVGHGQRVGIFAAAGVGKSTLLGMLARASNADRVVFGLVGERGRELNEILTETLGEDGLKRAVTVIATSDQPAMERVRAAHTATAIAEYFRDQGQNVLLLLDSVTRFARAQREIGLSMGEAPARRGFPPSVFAELPRLLERTGRTQKGSITAFYTVLVEDESEDDPIGEEVRSILDGHIVLSRALAETGQYPAIAPLKSVSRLINRIVAPEKLALVKQVRHWFAKSEEMEFLIKLGEYSGGQPEIDEALEKTKAIKAYFRQDLDDTTPIDASFSRLKEISS